MPSGRSRRSVINACGLAPLTRWMRRPKMAYPRFEYSKALPGPTANSGPLMTTASRSSSVISRCRSPHGSSVASPLDIVSKCRAVMGGVSDVGPANDTYSGTYWLTGSSSRRCPSSRRSSTAAAVKLFVIEAMRNSECSSASCPNKLTTLPSATTAAAIRGTRCSARCAPNIAPAMRSRSVSAITVDLRARPRSWRPGWRRSRHR
jgi:hypothetical protein